MRTFKKYQFCSFQMRFCLAIKDYIRTQIISKKISVRFFDKDQHQDLKLRYYQYMIELDQVSWLIWFEMFIMTKHHIRAFFIVDTE